MPCAIGEVAVDEFSGGEVGEALTGEVVGLAVELAELLAPHIDHLDVGDLDERLSGLASHDLAAQCQTIAGLEELPTLAASDGLGSIAHLLLSERDRHQSRHR